MKVKLKKEATRTGFAKSPVNMARRAFIADLLSRGVVQHNIIERCQLNNLFANKKLTGKAKQPKGQFKPLATHKLYVLRSSTIRELIQDVQREICDTVFDTDDMIAEGVANLRKAYGMAAEQGDVGNMGVCQREINRMLGLKKNGTVHFNVDTIRQQMEQMEAASGN